MNFRTIIATGQEHHGRDVVIGMLNYFYHITFEATATTRFTLFEENSAMGEYDFVGNHVAEFTGIPATGKEVRVPLYVVYGLENDQIKRGRVYFEMPALLQQLGILTGEAFLRSLASLLRLGGVAQPQFLP